MHTSSSRLTSSGPGGVSHTTRTNNSAGDQLDDRVLNRDRVAALAATAAEQQPAEDRNVVVPLQAVAALRASRRRRDDRLPQRQPIDHDVEEAADAGAEQRGVRAATAPVITARHPRRGAGAVRQRVQARTFGPRLDAPGRGIERERHAGADRPECRASACRPPAPATTPAGGRAAWRSACDAAIELVDRVHRVELLQPMPGVALDPVRRRSCRAARVHSWRDDCRLPPSASVVAASGASHVGAPGMSPAFLNHSAARA